jgi:hypothetical protein
VQSHYCIAPKQLLQLLATLTYVVRLQILPRTYEHSFTYNEPSIRSLILINRLLKPLISLDLVPSSHVVLYAVDLAES